MNRIRPWLFIGKYSDTLQDAYLRSKSIQAMLQLADRVEQPGIESLYLPVEDFAPLNLDLLEKGVAFIREQRKLDHRILVACGAGINRSSTFCTAVLKEEEGLGLLEAFKEVRKQHPESMPHEPVWESLCQYYGESVPYMEVMLLRLDQSAMVNFSTMSTIIKNPIEY